APGRPVMNLRLAPLALIGLFAATTASAQEPAVTPNKPDEPKAAQFSLRQAAAFIDDAAVGWTRKRNCGSCHSTYIYLMARPALQAPSAAEKEVRGFFENKAANWDTKKPQWDTEVVATAAA